MKALIKLHAKENFKGSSFLIFGILGSIITLIIIFQVKFSIEGVAATSDYAVFGMQWKLLSMIASLGAISLSMNTMAFHRRGTRKELLWLHGLEPEKQYFALILGNLLVSIAMAFVLSIPMMIQILVKGLDFPWYSIVFSFIAYGITVCTACVFYSLWTFILSPAVSALLGMVFIVMGTVRTTFLLLLGNKGGLFGKLGKYLIHILPPLDELSQITRDLFTGGAVDLPVVFRILLYLWLLLGMVYFVIKWVVQYEK
ncbi:MAG: hypothetical protein Q4P28_03815 [Tissierellia bacterium]|nr:hypothetical protein [Tissierellia bacterium]